MADDQFNLIRAGLFVGQEIAQGSARYRVENAAQRLRSLATGQFASPRAVLDAAVQVRLAQRDAILKDLASRLTVLLSASLKDLTGHQYATLRELAAMGHPYAKRHFRDARGRYNPRLRRGMAGLPSPPGAINAQTNFLASGFGMSLVQKPGGLWGVLCTNPALYAGYLAQGTGTMIGRSYDALAARAAQDGMAGEVAKATAKLEAIGEAVKGLRAPEIEFDLGGLRRDYKPK